MLSKLIESGRDYYNLDPIERKKYMHQHSKDGRAVHLDPLQIADHGSRQTFQDREVHLIADGCRVEDDQVSEDRGARVLEARCSETGYYIQVLRVGSFQMAVVSIRIGKSHQTSHNDQYKQ